MSHISCYFFLCFEIFQDCKNIVKYEMLQAFFEVHFMYTLEIQKQSFTSFLENRCSETFLKIHKKYL